MDKTEQLLRRLMGRRASALVQVRTGSGESGFHVVLLKAGDRQGDRGVWAELAGEGKLDIERLIKLSAPVLVKAQDGPRELSFVSCLLARHKPFLGGDRVLLGWPGSIKVQERRRSEREPIPASALVSIILLRGADGLFPPANVAVKTVDISLHGVCLICPAPVGALPKRGQDLQLQLKLDRIDHRIVGQYRGVENLSNGELRLRIEFNLDAMRAGAQEILAKLLEDFRSRRVRRELNCTISGKAG